MDVVITQFFTSYFCIYYKKYIFEVTLVILLFLFNFCVLKNSENHKKNTEMQYIYIEDEIE
jgi:hypothetical protein